MRMCGCADVFDIFDVFDVFEEMRECNISVFN